MSWHYSADEATVQDDHGDYLAVTHYFFYRKVDPAIRPQIAQHMTTAYVSGNTLQRVKPGDVLWIVTVHQHQLYVLGRLKVEFIVDDSAIAQDLIDPVPDSWQDADWYAISNKYAIEPMREIDITLIADKLRFISPVSEMLDIVDGRVDANQLISLRQLSTQTAQMMDDIWYNDAYTPSSVQDFLELSEDDTAYAEGRAVVRTVRERQRSRQLVNRAKTRFRDAHDGRLFCEVCGFDFDDAYGIDYIEAHHTEPIASLEEETANTVHSVVMLCANCHRAAHTRTPPYGIEELRKMINKD